MPKASKNFSWKELECKGCRKGGRPEYCYHNFVPTKNIDLYAITKLQALREAVGLPLTINSAARCLGHNKFVGGSGVSQHISTNSVKSNAFDVKVPKGMTPEELAFIAEEVGFDGIGIYNTFVHVDTRGNKARWNYRT